MLLLPSNRIAIREVHPLPNSDALSNESRWQIIRDSVRIMCASAEEQIEWTRNEGYPLDEILLQYLDLAPSWVYEMEKDGLLESTHKNAILGLQSYVSEMLETLDSYYFQEDSSLTAPAWQDLRTLSKSIIHKLPFESVHFDAGDDADDAG